MDNEYQGEEWLPLPEDSDYLISSYGRVKSLKSSDERLLRPANNNGYLHVNVPFDGKKRSIGIHRLVMLVFVGKCPNGYQVHHLDHNRSNNRLTNLLYVTPQENIQAAIPFRQAAEREKKRLKKAWQERHIKRLKAAMITKTVSLELAKDRFSQLSIPASVVEQVHETVNTFYVVFKNPLTERDLHTLDYCRLRLQPINKDRNEYRVTWEFKD